MGNSASDGVWRTNNENTAGEVYSNVGSISATNINTIPGGCFPAVVYEDRDATNGLAAVIRSVDASSKNNKARGELIYSSTNWNSRPSSVSFEYQYSSYNNENFEVNVFIKDKNGNTIGVGTRPNTAGANSDYQTCRVVIDYSVENENAAAIEILFASAESSFSTASSTTTVEAPDPSGGTGSVSYPATYTSFAGVKEGSVLKIDNVTLNYEEE